MARAMGATLMGCKNCLGKIKIFIYGFLNLYFGPHNYKLQSSINTVCPYLMYYKSGVLRQHHQILWQNCGIVPKHDSQTLWQNKNARMPYLQNTGLPIWLVWNQISKSGFFQHTWLFLMFWFSQKAKQNMFFFSRKGLALAKHCLSCMFVTNRFWRESMTMQGAKNIAKILLLPWKCSMYLRRNKCTTV